MSQYWGYLPRGLEDKLNWDLAFRGTRTSSFAPNTGARIRIPAITLTLESPVVLIGCKSDTAGLRDWYKGGYASMNLLYSPSVTSEFTAFVRPRSEILELGVLNQIQWPMIQPTPYVLSIKAPKYFDHWFVEVWTFSGSYDDLHTLTP